MYTIGQFSAICMITPKTLRFYDEVGLLKPASVDRWNGYRYYSPEQVGKTLLINLLRRFGFSIEEMKKLVTGSDSHELKAALEQKLEELTREEQRIAVLKDDIRRKLDVLMKGGSIMSETSRYAFNESNVKIITLEEPIHVIGALVRTPFEPIEERIRNIVGLIGSYFTEKMPEGIPNRKVPRRGFAVMYEYRQEDEAFNYLFGEEVTTLDAVPQGFSGYAIPAGTYALMTFQAESKAELTGETLSKANEYFHQTWFLNNGYRHGGAMEVEVYGCNFEREVNPEMALMAPVVKE